MHVYIVVEGQSEERFVKTSLGPHLVGHGVTTESIVVKTRRNRSANAARGGGHWKQWHGDIQGVLRQSRPEIRVTTLFDLYGLPGDFPRLSVHQQIGDTLARVRALEEEMARSIGDRRFIAYIQRHEFEALVLACLESLRAMLDEGGQRGLDELQEALQGVGPEDVDDGQQTAPSKRLARHIPRYGKIIHGTRAIATAGLPRVRAACPRFDAWVTKLERLAETTKS